MPSPQHLLDALPADLPANLSSAQAAIAIADRIMGLRESAAPPKRTKARKAKAG